MHELCLRIQDALTDPDDPSGALCALFDALSREESERFTKRDVVDALRTFLPHEGGVRPSDVAARMLGAITLSQTHPEAEGWWGEDVSTSERPAVRVVIGVLSNAFEGGHMFVARRAGPRAYAGCWEHPGGKVEPGELDEEALRREWREELGADITVGPRIYTGWASPTEIKPFEAVAYRVTLRWPAPVVWNLSAHDRLWWASPGSLLTLPDDARTPLLATITRAARELRVRVTCLNFRATLAEDAASPECGASWTEYGVDHDAWTKREFATECRRCGSPCAQRGGTASMDVVPVDL